ncbi:hypothetical protein AIA08_003778 [Salmonella enterica subsp. enterica serovar Wichita]|nr:hypothetical protein [Salmonella enterica subsp. enterica serovar Wichita]
MFKPGFITPPWPHTRGDSVSARHLIQRLKNEANRGCGLYYEIYEHRLLNGLLDLHSTLNASDAATFRDVAVSCGCSLAEHDIRNVNQAYTEIMDEIRRGQE